MATAMTVDELAKAICAEGWLITVQRNKECPWTACLHKQAGIGLDDFFGVGETCLEAMRAAIAERDGCDRSKA